MAKEVTGNLVEVQTPKFVSLVGKPANKVAFKIVRSDTPEGETPMKTPVIRRARRSEPSAILGVTFPAGTADDAINDQLKAYGLTGYSVQRGEDGSVLALRSDLKSISNDMKTVEVKLAEGIVATVERQDAEPATSNPKSGLTVTALHFSSGSFTEDEVITRLDAMGITAEIKADGKLGEVTGYSVQRAEVPEGEETRVVEIEPGLAATVIRSDAYDIPDGYVAVVNESCYGHWGWGQLDFTAKMADKEFSRAMDDATWSLRSVLEDILLYSSLPLADRKTLMVNALEQFKSFAVGILDSLPRTVLVAVARSATPQLEKDDMSKKDASGGSGEQTQAATGDTPITRSELDTAMNGMKSEILAAIAASKTPAEPVQRSEEPAAGTGNQGEGKTAEGEQKAEASITRADIVSAVADALKPVVERMEKIEGSTVMRSDGSEPVVDSTKTAEGDGKTTTKDVFRGAPVFAGLRSGVSKA